MNAATILFSSVVALVLLDAAGASHAVAAQRKGRAGASACNALAGDAPAVTTTSSSAKVPPAAGGQLSDGTYVLSAMTIYTPLPIPSMSLSTVMQVTGSTIQQVATMNGQEKRFTTSFSTSGSSITMADTCPVAKSGIYGYTATPTEFRMYLNSPIGKIEQTYTKR